MKIISLCLSLLLLPCLVLSQTIEEIEGQIDSLFKEKEKREAELKTLSEAISQLEDQRDAIILEEELGQVIFARTSTMAELRTKPYWQSQIIELIVKDTPVGVLTSEGIYCKVKYEDHIGYIEHSDLVWSKELEKLKNEVKLNTSNQNSQQMGVYSSSSSTKSSTKSNTSSSRSSTSKYTPSTRRVYHTGPKGGCYYINSNGNKTYVDRSKCN